MGNMTVLAKRRIQTTIQVIVALVLGTLLLASFYSLTANAQSATSTANTLKVSPVRTDIEVKPGTVKTVQTVVTNLTNNAITVRPSANDFVSNDDSGTPSLILDEGQFANSHSLKRFITPLADVTIPANEAKTINVVITVPPDAKAGGYYGAIRFAPTTPDTGGQVNLSASVASLILLTVPGDLIEQVELTGFDVTQNGKANTLFTSSEGLVTVLRFVNNGNVQVGPFGKLSVLKGDKVVYEADFNNKTPRDVILPDSSRKWSIPLDKIDGFGQYKVQGTFTYGGKNKTVEVTKTFWVIPLYMMIIAGAVLLVLIATAIIIILAVLRRRRRGGGSRRNFRF